MNADGSEITRLTHTANRTDKFSQHGAFDQTPCFTCDGRKVVFSPMTSIQEGTDAAYELHLDKRDFYRQIFIVNADGTNQKPLTVASQENYEPTVSPDGKRIAFVSERNGNSEIYVMNIDGTGQTRLTKSSANNSQPAWSPDSKMIAWVQNSDHRSVATDSYHANNEIWVMNVDGTGQERLTLNNYDERKPQWLKSIPTWKLHQNLPYVTTQIPSQQKQ